VIDECAPYSAHATPYALADWFTEAGYQHGTYMAFLGGVSVVPPPNLVDQR